MAVGFRALEATTYATRTNTTVAVPAGVQDGDVLLLWFVIGASGTAPTPTDPSGWTLFAGFPQSVTDVGAFNVATRVYRRRASGEPADYTVTHASASSQAIIYACQEGDIAATQLTQASGEGTTGTAPGLTTAGDNALVIFWEHNWELYGAVTPPAGSTPTFTERIDLATSLLYLADGILASAGATGDQAHANGNPQTHFPWRAGLLAVENVVPPPAPVYVFPSWIKV